MSETNPELSRRELLFKTTGIAAVGLGISPLTILPVHAENSSQPRRQLKNDYISIGLIGCGGMGPYNMLKLMDKPGVAITALCDVDDGRMHNNVGVVEKRYGKRPALYRDYRKMLAREKSMDAVIIGTPDHWHALNLIHAVEAGKDAYCEKPISHDIVEAKMMDAAVRQHQKIVQVGTWQRSTKEFTDAIAYVKAGKIGPVTTIRAWMGDTIQVGKNQPMPVPKTFDYNLWTGPAQMRPYKPNEVHGNWRWFLTNGSGMTGDWGVHMIDIGLLGMSKDTDLVMPTQVSAFGGKLAFPDDDRTAPDTVLALLKFQDPNFILHWETGRNHEGREGHGTEFIGADGRSVMVWRGGWIVRDAEGKELPKEESAPTNDHWQNWLDCLRTREQPRSNLASMAQTTIVCHLINAAVQVGETVRWSKETMDIVGRVGRDSQSYARDYRKPFQLPAYKI